MAERRTSALSGPSYRKRSIQRCHASMVSFRGSSGKTYVRLGFSGFARDGDPWHESATQRADVKDSANEDLPHELLYSLHPLARFRFARVRALLKRAPNAAVRIGPQEHPRSDLRRSAVTMHPS